MQAYLISDGEFLSTRHDDLRSLVSQYLREHNLEIVEKQINRDELAFCRGCFDCWVKTPGECAMKDGIAEINREEGVVGRSRELSWRRLGTPDRMRELQGYIEEAVTLASTDTERQRVETWKTGVWDYMKTGYDKWASRSDLTLR